MKYHLLLIFVFSSTFLFAQNKDINYSVKYTFSGVIDGYDHEEQLRVFVDGKLIAESPVKRLSKVNKFKFKVPEGKHTVQFQSYILYNGNWEAFLKENNYSLDAMYTKEVDLLKQKKQNIALHFDIKNATVNEQ